jgi:DNA processing protein
MTGATPAARRGRVEPAGAPRAIPRGDARYPAAFEDLEWPPATWHVRGRWPLTGPAVAIVGSRAATAYGRAMARRLAFDLAGLGVVVVSGLAHGIDAAAHAGACEAGGATLAVLPGGIDHVVPGSHRALAVRILERGAWGSEHAAGEPAFRGRFLERNRLIAALARATVVVEAARRSGALSTAAAARRLGRELFAVPGDVDRETSRGCHALLRAGARVCEGADDVLRVIGVVGRADDPVDRLRTALADEPATVEALARAAGLTARETAALLLKLSWSGLAAPRPGQRWVRGA